MEELRLGISVHSERFDEQDRIWLDQENEFFATLRENGVPLTREFSTEAGGKGLADTIVMGLASASVIKVAAECWKAWLTRDRTRRIELNRTSGGVEESFTLTAQDIPDGHFDKLVDKLIDQLKTDE